MVSRCGLYTPKNRLRAPRSNRAPRAKRYIPNTVRAVNRNINALIPIRKINW